MAGGTTFKVCGCRGEDGKLLSKKCPKLRRKGGSWSPSHGTWYYQLEMPPKADGTRRSPLRRGGFATQDDAETELDTAVELLAIAVEQDGKTQIADLITTSFKKTKALPEPDEVRRKVRTGQDLDTTITTGEWLAIWLAGRKKLRKGTLRSYESHIRRYYAPHIGDVPLDRLRVSDVAGVFEAIDELNDTITEARTSCDPVLRAKVKGRRLVSPATKQRIRATLRAALNAAIRQRRIDLNVASLVELPSGKRPKALVWTPERVTEWREAFARHVALVEQRKKRLSMLEPDKGHGSQVNQLDAYVGTPRPSAVMVWTPEQTADFLHRAQHHRLYALYYLIAMRGLRRGEACGLHWPDLNLDEGTVTVRWQLVQNGSEVDQGKPKSEAGDRQISLDQHTVKELRAHKARQNAERLAAGAGWEESGLVFTTETGAPLIPNEVTDQFQLVAMDAGLPPIRLHDLRHGAATILLRAGYDIKVVQETLGLSSITIAADTYTSVLPDLARQSAADAAAVLINASKRRQQEREKEGEQLRTLGLTTPGDAEEADTEENAS
jgi:integrase